MKGRLSASSGGGVREEDGIGMEPPEQEAPEVVEGLLRVAELEDQISALARQHRRVRLGVFAMLVMLVGAAIGALGSASAWGWTLVGVLLVTSWGLWASRAEMQRITERKEGLLLQLDAVKQRGRLHAPDDATVESGHQNGPEVAS